MTPAQLDILFEAEHRLSDPGPQRSADPELDIAALARRAR